MPWAARRRFIITFAFVAIVAALAISWIFRAFYTVATCVDGVQNQGEQGVDCGGPCQYICAYQALKPKIVFTRAFFSGTKTVGVAALITNQNATIAAKDVPYTVTLYGENQVFVHRVTGTVDLPAGATVPVYVPGVSVGNQQTIRAFLEIEDTAPTWFTLRTDPRPHLTTANAVLGGTPDLPRIDAPITNDTAVSLTDVKVIVFVSNTRGDVIAASQTILPDLPARGSATATFTWGSAFSETPATIEVFPVLPLPAPLES